MNFGENKNRYFEWRKISLFSWFFGKLSQKWLSCENPHLCGTFTAAFNLLQLNSYQKPDSWRY